MLANELAPSAGVPPWPMLTRRVVAPARSRAKTSVRPLVSPATRLLASELNATVVQPPSMAGRNFWAWLGPFAGCPLAPTLTSVEAWLSRSYTKTSVNPLLSSGTIFVASE